MIEHYGPSGRVFRFETPDGLYPVNRYQSLVLATSAYLEAATYAAETGHPPREMRAIEFCCGGGAAAIMLKAAGLGYVEATDVNPRSLEACRNNASVNRIALDRVGLYDLLNPPPPPAERFDLAVCNPPCGSPDQVEFIEGAHLRAAIDGGPGGTRFIAPLLSAARDCLRPGGRLVFIITSTMAFRDVQAELDRQFPRRWRLDHTTPIAQPYVSASSPDGRRMLERIRRREIFAWRGADEQVWRLSWVVVVGLEAAAWVDHDPRLWLTPRYYNPSEPGYAEALRHFSTTDGP